MSNSHDGGVLQAEFHAVAKALAHEIRKEVASSRAAEPDHPVDALATDEERLLNSVHSRHARPEIGRLIAQLHEIGVALRERNLPFAELKQ